MKIGDQDKSWAPHVICGTYQSNLEECMRGDHYIIPFAIPRIWREQQNHVADYHFCIQYADILSSIVPVPLSEELFILRPSAKNLESESENFDIEESYIGHIDEEEKPPHFLNQQKLDDLIRDLGLTKSNVELLTSRLKERNLLHSNCRATAARKRHDRFSMYFL